MTTQHPAADATRFADITRTANTVWRRAGVRRADRASLLDELSGELISATDAGLDPDSVVGADPVDTLRCWADERGLSGRAPRLGIVVPATIGGATLGLGAVLTLLYLGFRSNLAIEPFQAVLAIYAMSGALAYLSALACTWVALRAVGDGDATETTCALAWMLPLTALVAVGAGVGTARTQGFDTDTSTFVTTVAAVCLVVGVGAVLARRIALRRPDVGATS